MESAENDKNAKSENWKSRRESNPPIHEALRFHEVPHYMRRIIRAYLADRHVSFISAQGWKRHSMTCGVPQGSILGPLLWNIGYDWVLRGSNLEGIDVTCYADDTLVTAHATTYREATILATAGVAHVVGRIRRLGLKVALDKSEAILFHGPRGKPPVDAHIVVSGVRINLGPTLKYLGVVLDGRWSFRAHFECLVPRLIGTVAALGRILPNLGGPEASCRRLYLGVVRSMALYGAPVWVDALNRRNIALLQKPQRVMAIRVIRGYRTIATEAACVLAGSVPWDLEAGVLASMYYWREEARSQGSWPAPRELLVMRERFCVEATACWSARLEHPNAGHRVVEAVRPVLRQWLNRGHGPLTFRLTQVLSGHGCFGRYLCRIAGREPTMECKECGHAEDTAQHSLSECPAWAPQRTALSAVVGNDLSLQAVVKSMVGSDRSWKAMLSFCEDVVAQKERAERAREDDPSSALVRRRRVGRRRLAQDRRLPP